MSVKFGEIDSSQILDNEYRINILERVIDILITENPKAAEKINITQVREDVVKDLQGKYPNSGIKLKG